MKPVAFVSVALAMLGATLPTPLAQADADQIFRKIVIDVEAPLAIPLSSPLRDRFGVGAMPSLSAATPVGKWTLLGLRLRGGFLSNGSAPSDPSIHDPSMGGLVSLSGIVRFRPLAGHTFSYSSGPWIDAGVGPGMTGTLLRASFEAGAGWNFRRGKWLFGPVVRYLQVIETSNALDSTDAKLALVGIEVVLRDAHRPAPVVATVEPPPPPKPVEVVGDRDKDGILDNVDQCPDDPEDKDGFEDSDGCPDPDNDRDSIPDKNDACPNEPETVNGVEDQDGCPDTAPIVVRENRILLTEHVLFDTNFARVKSGGRPALGAVLTLWKQHPEWDHLVIEGHADRHGPDPFNDWLSNERAERARKVLVELGFPPEKIVVAGFGKRQPRVQGADDDADRENRRVEFVIIKKVEERPEAPDPTQPPAATSVTLGGLQP
jgi:outer membrane protein OmpA-like peptidoglycan-associated protein